MLDKRTDGSQLPHALEGLDEPDDHPDIPTAEDGSERLPF